MKSPDLPQANDLNRRDFLRVSMLGSAGILTALTKGEALAAPAKGTPAREPNNRPPNILFIMTDQQRADTIAALGNADIYTPNMDRLVRRGVAFTRAYSPCPVCVPTRYTIRTGCDPKTTGVYGNFIEPALPGQAATIDGRCGAYLAQTMKGLGYRTFGIGKFHTMPADEALGYEVHLYSEEFYDSAGGRHKDAYAQWILSEHPEYAWVDQLMGERTEMYYMPQMSPLPPELGVEWWAADRAVEQIATADSRPWFGFVSFIGPHPPLAPPQTFARMYHPDRMSNPVRGELTVDHMDEQIPWMNYMTWSEDINDPHARILKARYYGEVSYIDYCLGRILDAVEARPDADNTLICFYSDHGELLGDHHGWQKECYFEASCRIPFLLSWPARLPKDVRRADLVSLTDLFGIATTAAGAPELRDGADVLGVLAGMGQPRQRIFGTHLTPGTPKFKIMVIEGDWKYIYMAGGGREQLFNLKDDPHELKQRAQDESEITARLRTAAAEYCDTPSARRALDENGKLKVFPFASWGRVRMIQFAFDRVPNQFPHKPQDALKELAIERR